MDEPMKVHKRPHTSLEMAYTTVYIPKELKEKAKLRGLNLSALLERAMHQELRDRVSLDQWKELVQKQLDIIIVEVNKEPQQKPGVILELQRLRSAINKLEGDAYVKVEEK